MSERPKPTLDQKQAGDKAATKWIKKLSHTAQQGISLNDQIALREDIAYLLMRQRTKLLSRGVIERYDSDFPE